MGLGSIETTPEMIERGVTALWDSGYGEDFADSAGSSEAVMMVLCAALGKPLPERKKTPAAKFEFSTDGSALIVASGGRSAKLLLG